jgi:hypothetical protein
MTPFSTSYGRLRNLIIRRRAMMRELDDIHPLAVPWWRRDVRLLEAQIRGEVLSLHANRRPHP